MVHGSYYRVAKSYLNEYEEIGMVKRGRGGQKLVNLPLLLSPFCIMLSILRTYMSSHTSHYSLLLPVTSMDLDFNPDFRSNSLT